MSEEIEGKIRDGMESLGYEIDTIETEITSAGNYVSKVGFKRYEQALQFVGKENSGYARYLSSLGGYKVHVFFVNGMPTNSFVAEHVGGENNGKSI